MEYLQVQVAVHTAPNRADSDGDGLNDSEEVNLGSDGFATNPWKADTDGDGISDSLEARGWSWSGSTIVANVNGFKTDPTRTDTDRDGVPDNRDRAPLGDAFVQVVLLQARVFGSDPNDPAGPQPFAMASLRGNTTYTPWAGLVDGWAYWSTSPTSRVTYPGHYLSVDVPDDATSVDVTVQLWSYDSQGNSAHTGIAIAHTVDGQGACVDVGGPVTFTYGLQAPGQSTSYDLAGCGDTSTLNAAPLTVVVTTMIPDRLPTDLVVPADYAGIYNMTDSQGMIVGRHYTGEPRFVALLLNVTAGYGDTPFAVLVPRSLFVQSRLYAYLNSTAPPAVYGRLSFRQNLTSSAWNADDLQALLAGNVSVFEYDGILADLLVDAAGASIGRSLELFYATDQAPDYPLAYSLPDGVLRLVGYRPPPTASSVSYTFCPSGCAPTEPPWWEKVWDGIVAVVTAVVSAAIVIAATAFAVLVQVLSQVGNWFAKLVSDAVQVVKSAVEAAGKVVGQILDFLGILVSAMLRPLFSPIVSLINGWAFASGAVLDASWREFQERQSNTEETLAALRNTLLTPLLVLGLLATAITVVLYVTLPVSFGISSLAGLIAGAIATALIQTVLQSASLPSGAGSLTTLSALEGLAKNAFEEDPGGGSIDLTTFFDWALPSIDAVLGVVFLLVVNGLKDPTGTADAIFAITYGCFGFLMLFLVSVVQTSGLYEQKWVAFFEGMVALVAFGASGGAMIHSENEIVRTLGFIGALMGIASWAFALYKEWVAIH